MAGPAQREAAQRRAAGEFFGGQAQRVFGVAAVAGDVAVRDQDGFAILQMGAQQPQQGVLAATRGAHQVVRADGGGVRAVEVVVARRDEIGAGFRLDVDADAGHRHGLSAQRIRKGGDAALRLLQRIARQLAGQGDVERVGVEHVGVAPARQHGLLFGR
ncbi:hypothetical protein G6F22_018384 [Rhizopus arrhizus]|nr:hypothetical protein G6F22_018384 [Rhizopus arrhizus]